MRNVFKSFTGAGTEGKAAQAAFSSALNKGAEMAGAQRGAREALGASGLVTSQQALQGVASKTFGYAGAGAAIGSMNVMNGQDSFQSAQSGAMAGAVVGGLMGARRLTKQISRGSVVQKDAVSKLAKGRTGVGQLQRMNSFSGTAANAFSWKNGMKGRGSGIQKGPIRNADPSSHGGTNAAAAHDIVRSKLRNSSKKQQHSFEPDWI